jgi:hypothetical protein
MTSFTPRLLYLREKNPRHPLFGRFVPRVGMDAVENRNINFPLLRIETEFLGGQDCSLSFE